jgi:hypothetical protein
MQCGLLDTNSALSHLAPDLYFLSAGGNTYFNTNAHLWQPVLIRKPDSDVRILDPVAQFPIKSSRKTRPGIVNIS